MEDLTLTEKNGSLYLNGKLLAVKGDIEKYGLPAVELALLRRTENVTTALDLLQEARVLLKKGPAKVSGVSFLEGSQVNERRQEFVHYELPLADEKGKGHELELVKFGKTIYGIFVDGKIVATNGMAEEPKALVKEILGLAGKSLGSGEVAKLNTMLAQVASIKSSRDYVIVTVVENERRRGVAA
ncbi:MAG: hypothetical protein Q7T16_04045 [Candidatus Burarchaeum sp.]|nr:hypothetical protein [Candidatus Burarchaeum sp.]MDO8339801.1 hypothetical protein [Candidatus Burarchaeum sp.]